MIKNKVIFIIFLLVLTFYSFPEETTSYRNQQYIFSWDNYNEDQIRDIKKELDQNIYSPFEMIGWSKNGLFAYRYRYYIDAAPAVVYNIAILNSITDEIIENDSITVYGWNSDNESSYIEYKNKWNNMLEKYNIIGRIEDPISSNFKNDLQIFPINNISCWFDYTIIKYDEWDTNDIIKWKMIIGNNTIQKTITEKSERPYVNIAGRKILGYFKSPYENRIVVVTNYYFTYFGPGSNVNFYGCNMDVGLGL